MKKHIKWLLSIVTALTMTIGVVAPSVSAQDTNWDEVITQLNEANQELVSMEGDATIDLSVQDAMEASVTADFRYNLEPEFAAEGNASLTGEIVFPDAEGNPQSMPIDFAGQLAVVDSIAYIFDGQSWTVEDISEVEQEFTDQFNQIMEQAQEQASDMTGSSELTQKYFDLSETDSEYVMVMHSDIDAEEFMADAEEFVDIEDVKQESLDQAIEQAEAAAEMQGEVLTEEDRAELEAQFDQAFDAGMNMAFEIIDHLEVRYSKETNYMTYTRMDMNFTEEDLAEMAAQMGESAETMEPVNLTLSMEFNFRNHGETFDIAVPEEAPTFDGSEGTDESEDPAPTDESEDSAATDELEDPAASDESEDPAATDELEDPAASDELEEDPAASEELSEPETSESAE